MKSPKQLFLENTERAFQANEKIADPDVQAALHAAFANLCWNLPGSENPQRGWNANCVRDGARRLIEELNMITKPSTTPNKPFPRLEPDTTSTEPSLQ